MDPKTVAKLFGMTSVGLVLLGIGGLLTVYVDKLQDKDINNLRERVLTLEAQVNDIRKKAEEAKENEEVDAE